MTIEEISLNKFLPKFPFSCPMLKKGKVYMPVDIFFFILLLSFMLFIKIEEKYIH